MNARQAERERLDRREETTTGIVARIRSILDEQLGLIDSLRHQRMPATLEGASIRVAMPGLSEHHRPACSNLLIRKSEDFRKP